jgi:hypothetical protein
MKLRLRGNSIRLRLTQSEVSRFRAEGKIEERVRFGDNEPDFVYALEIGPGNSPAAKFEGGAMRVFISEKHARGWIESEQNAIESPEGISPRVLIEKDFACLEIRPGENDKDAFPTPRK